MTTFGIEVECIHPAQRERRDVIEELGRFMEGTGWNVVFGRDRYSNDTIYADHEGSGIEVRTPVMTVEDWPKYFHMIRGLKQLGCTVNVNCGQHVHLGWGDRASHLYDYSVYKWLSTFLKCESME